MFTSADTVMRGIVELLMLLLTSYIVTIATYYQHIFVTDGGSN